MHERTLLIAAACTALAGICALGLLPERAMDETQAFVVWTNGTHAWAYTGKMKWVEFKEEQDLEVNHCYPLIGRSEGTTLSSALPSQASLSSPRLCP